MSLISLVKLITRFLMVLVLWMRLFSACLPLVYRKITSFMCYLLCSKCLSALRGFFWGVESSGSVMSRVILSAKKMDKVFSYLCSYYLLFLFTSLAKTSSLVLNRS